MKKKWMVGLAVFCLIVCFSLRVYLVNRDVERITYLEYPKGEVIPVGENFFRSSAELMDGYSVKVVDSQIVSTEEYLAANGRQGEGDGDAVGLPEYWYLVKVEFTNENAESVGEGGIDLSDYTLRGSDYMLTLNPAGIELVNDDLASQRFSLLPDKPPFEVVIPFGIFTETNAIEHVGNDPPALQICAYPESKLLLLA
jgi:hypothetical protein